MKFNTKVILSYVAIIVMPLLLAVIIGTISLNLSISSMEKKYGIEVEVYDCFFNQTHVLDLMTKSYYENLVSSDAVKNGTFSNSTELNRINTELKDRNSFLAVRIRNGQKDAVNWIDTGAAQLKDGAIWTPIKNYIEQTDIRETMNSTVYFSTEDANVDEYIIKIGSYTENQNTTAFYIITNVTDSLQDIKDLLVQTIVLTVVLTVLLGTVLAVWMYKSVISPIKKLNSAIRKVAMGNLDFSVKSTATDEFGQLFNSFDKMREHLKSSIERQIASEEENKELISNISHDLKTPLTAIKGYCEGIIDGVADTEEKKAKYVQTIYNKASDMDKLIGELVLISKLESNNVPYNFSKLDVNAYFSECVEEIRTELDSKNIKLAYINGLPEKVSVMADKEQLKRVINNIISNAVKYMDKEDQRIFIRIDEDENSKKSIRVSIKDNGRGVKEEELDQIFKRFFRADSSRNSEQGGSGIGLAVVKKIIEDHGGRVWATGAEGQGLTMNFTLKKMTKDTF